MAERLHRMASQHGEAEVILDTPGEAGVWYDETHPLGGFTGLTSNSQPFPPVSAWSRAMYHLSRTIRPGDRVWFIEDDVAFDPISMEQLVSRTPDADLAAIDILSRVEDPGWYYWHEAEGCFPRPARAFQPFCRLSARLVELALEFRETQGRFSFHEILFASLARENELVTLDWKIHPSLGHLFGSFRYRPVLDTLQAGVCHPVKDPGLHERICGA